MPTQAYIRYKEKGFWIPESFIEVLSQFICEVFEFKGIDNYSPALKTMYLICDANRGGSAIEMVGIPLDRCLLNLDDKESFISTLQETKTLILSKGAELSISTLNEFESNKIDPYFISEWHFPVKTQSLASTINIIIQMLNGDWDLSSYSVYYAGFPKPNNAPEI